MNEINLIRLAVLGAIIILSTLLSIVLISIKKGNRKANLLIVTTVLIWTSGSLSSLLMFSGIYKMVPTLVLIAYPFVFIAGAIYYFYIQLLLNKDFKFKGYHLFHFIPLFYAYYKLKGFFFLSFDKKVSGLATGWFGDNERTFYDFVTFSIPSFITIAYLILCLFLISKTVLKLKNDFSNTDIEFLSWLKRFTIIYLVLIVIDVIRLGLSIKIGWDLGEGEIITNLLIAVLIQYYIFQVIKNPERVFYSLYESKKVKSIAVINEKHLKKLDNGFSKKLSTFMETEKPFLNPELKCHELAAMLSVTPHYLSKIINQDFNVNFYNFINKYRVEEFKEKVLKDENKNLTLSAVAQNVGFNSKSSFNRIFKSITLITPTQYLKQNINRETV